MLIARSFRRRVLARFLLPAAVIASFAVPKLGLAAVQPAAVEDPTKNPIPAAADAGAPVPTEQAKASCKSCMMQSSSSRSSVPLGASALVAGVLVLRRRRRAS
jgi:hypothetical protein